MKTKLKPTLIVALATLALICLSSFLSQQPAKNKFLTLRINEVPIGVMMDPGMYIVYEDGKMEQVELGRFKGSNFADNTKKINQVMNDLAQKGYDLVTATGDGFYSIYTFEKK